MLPEWLLLVGAGFAGGVLNAIAGGGSFITFPALLIAGVPPVSANATNTFASCAGYLSGVYAFRHDLRKHRRQLPGYILLSCAGGLAGAWLLLQMPERLFRDAIPWLLLFASLLFIFGGSLHKLVKSCGEQNRHASTVGTLLLVLMFLCVTIYGGFFNAGLGIIILSYLALAGYSDINTMNGLKLLVSAAVSLVAILLFVAEGAIAWYQGSLVLAGTLMGGYVAAHFSRLLPQKILRNFVIAVSIITALYYFYEFYF